MTLFDSQHTARLLRNFPWEFRHLAGLNGPALLTFSQVLLFLWKIHYVSISLSCLFDLLEMGFYLPFAFFVWFKSSLHVTHSLL